MSNLIIGTTESSKLFNEKGIECVAVPVSELQKLEKSRGILYEFLEDKLTQLQLYELTSLTEQLWKVANTKSWGNKDDT